MQSGKEHIFHIPVAVEFTNGDRAEASLLMPRQNMKIIDMLNRDCDFLDMQMADGDVVSMAKTAIRSIRGRETKKVKDLGAGLNDEGRFDPHEILRVPKGADAEAIHHSYLALARQYHPDSYAALPLPAEVMEYLTGMLKRINAAYAMLEPRANRAAA
jgi:DnaJ-domain-containing protein 1